MFTLANKFSFVPNPEMCFLSVFLNSNAGNRCSAHWALKAHSKASSIRSHQKKDETQAGLESVTVGIDCNGLSFNVLGWKELAGRSFDIDPASITGGLMVFEWEAISALHLTFGHARGNALQVQALGRGYVESEPEYFGTDEIEFSIDTSLEFTGVHTEVPINTPAPIAFSKAQVRHLFPNYDYAEPKLIETKYGGRLFGIGVHFPPRESIPT